MVTVCLSDNLRAHISETEDCREHSSSSADSFSSSSSASSPSAGFCVVVCSTAPEMQQSTFYTKEYLTIVHFLNYTVCFLLVNCFNIFANITETSVTRKMLDLNKINLHCVKI